MSRPKNVTDTDLSKLNIASPLLLTNLVGFDKEGIKYVILNDNSCAITGNSINSTTSINISTVTNGSNTYKVVAVYENAFKDNISITSVKLPECLSVGESAFSGCSALTEVEFPKCTL